MKIVPFLLMYFALVLLTKGFVDYKTHLSYAYDIFDADALAIFSRMSRLTSMKFPLAAACSESTVVPLATRL